MKLEKDDIIQINRLRNKNKIYGPSVFFDSKKFEILEIRNDTFLIKGLKNNDEAFTIDKDIIYNNISNEVNITD